MQRRALNRNSFCRNKHHSKSQHKNRIQKQTVKTSDTEASTLKSPRYSQTAQQISRAKNLEKSLSLRTLMHWQQLAKNSMRHSTNMGCCNILFCAKIDILVTTYNCLGSVLKRSLNNFIRAIQTENGDLPTNNQAKKFTNQEISSTLSRVRNRDQFFDLQTFFEYHRLYLKSGYSCIY